MSEMSTILRIQSLNALSSFRKPEAAQQARSGAVFKIEADESEESASWSDIGDVSSRELTEEDQELLEQLKSELVALLSKGDEATPQDEKRIQEIAEQIEKLTGLKGLARSGLSNALEMFRKTGGKDEDDEEPESASGREKTDYAVKMRLSAMALPDGDVETGPGLMSFIRKAANQAYQSAARAV